jgi:hypothetical protein
MQTETRARRRSIVLLTFAALAASCMDTLPDQDRRILDAHPSAKLSTTQLWKAYAADAKAADKLYWGKVVEVSGKVWSVHPDAPASVMFVEQDPHGVQANLLEDQAPAILKDATPGVHMILRCYDAGFKGDVILKSCIEAK